MWSTVQPKLHVYSGKLASLVYCKATLEVHLAFCGSWLSNSATKMLILSFLSFFFVSHNSLTKACKKYYFSWGCAFSYLDTIGYSYNFAGYGSKYGYKHSVHDAIFYPSDSLSCWWQSETIAISQLNLRSLRFVCKHLASYTLANYSKTKNLCLSLIFCASQYMHMCSKNN